MINSQHYPMSIADDFKLHMDIPYDAIAAIKAAGEYIHAKDKEYSFLILLDENYSPIGAHIIGIGTTTSVSMGAAEIFRMVAMTGACGFITMHNHPAGTYSGLKASINDNNNTDRLIQLSNMTGIILVDNIIVSREDSGPVFLSNRETEKHHPSKRRISLQNVGEFYLPEETFPPLPDALSGWEDNPIFLSHYTEEELAKIYPNKDFDFER